MPMEKAEPGSQPPIVDELHDRVQFIEPVFQRRSRQDQCKARTQRLDHPRRLGRPVLDPLPFIQNDQVPLHLLNRLQVAHHLFVIADREKTPVVILFKSLLGRSHDQLRIAIAETADFAEPLRFERSRTDHQHTSHPCHACQQLGHADPLDRLAQSHIVGQHGAPRTDSERDAIQLVGQQRFLEQFGPQRMLGRCTTDLFDHALDVAIVQTLLYELFRVGIQGHFLTRTLQLLDGGQQPRNVLDRLVQQSGQTAFPCAGQVAGREQAQFQLAAILQMNRETLRAIGPLPRPSGKAGFDASQHMQDMLAGSQRIDAKIGTGTIRITPFGSAQRHAIGFSRQLARHQIIGPGCFAVARFNPEPLVLRPQRPFGYRTLFQNLFAEQLERRSLFGNIGQPQRKLLVEDKPECRSHMLARGRAMVAVTQNTSLAIALERNRHAHRFSCSRAMGQRQAKQIAAEVHIPLEIHLHKMPRPSAHQPLGIGPQQFVDVDGREVGQAIAQCANTCLRFRAHAPCLLRCRDSGGTDRANAGGDFLCEALAGPHRFRHDR